MKNTVVAAKTFSIGKIKFFPGDEFDYKALGLDFYEFKKFINVRYLSYGVPGREISEVINSSGYEFDEENWKIGSPKEDIDKKAIGSDGKVNTDVGVTADVKADVYIETAEVNVNVDVNIGEKSSKENDTIDENLGYNDSPRRRRR